MNNQETEADKMAEEQPSRTVVQSSRLSLAMGSLSSQQKIALMVAAAAFIALVIGMWMWGQNPDYRVLYTNLSDRDGGAIIDSLQQQNIPYKFSEGGGALLVPGNLVHEVRLRLASQGLPKGSLVGFELMENQKFGTSQFLEQVNYQRALEGELARSMQTLAAVQTARVHLALPKPSVFVKEQLKPSASVVLSLYPGRTLDPSQVNGIIHLVSSSVADMPAKNVTILDQSGSMLSTNREGSDTPMDATQIKYVRQIEQDYVKRIEAIVSPLIGADNVHAQITADIDFSQAEQTAETFRPNQPPNEASVRSQQTLETKNSGAQNAAGVPGALSNQPPVPATAPIVTPASAVADASGASGGSLRKESTTNFEVDRTIRYTKLPVGSIKRLSVAVIVNNRMATDKSGKAISSPLSEGEKAQIEALVKEAMGFSASRGDTLKILNSEFSVDKSRLIEDVPIWKQPEMITLAKDALRYFIIAGIGLYLLFGVIRPSLKNIENARLEHEAEKLAAVTAEAEEAESEEEEAANTRASYEESLMAAKIVAQHDPKLVAIVIKEWVSKDE
jgi:flagellar M-ring protein FliF